LESEKKRNMFKIKKYCEEDRVMDIDSDGEILKCCDYGLDTSPILATVSSSGGIIGLSRLAQGSAAYERVGRVVRPQRVELTMLFETILAVQAGGDMGAQSIRYCLVWDKQPAGALPNFDQIFAIQTSAGTESASFLSPQRLTNQQRFVVLLDRVFDVNPVGISSTTPAFHRFYNTITEELDVSDLGETTYVGQTSSTGAVGTGSLLLMYRAAQNNAASQSAVLASSTGRVWYKDH